MSINQKKTKTLFEVGFSQLNDFQKEIFNECIKRNSGGLSLPMGSGKTLIAIILALYNVKDTGLPILIVCAKSLITSWEFEIRKFFGKELKYEYVHKGDLKSKMKKWKVRDDVQLILTTPDNIRIFYKENDVRDEFVKTDTVQLNDRWNLQQNVLRYKSPDKPLLHSKVGGSAFYSQEWGTIIIDEAQKYTNIKTLNCQSLCSLYSKKRWVLSGTMFDEPVTKKALGYFKLIDDEVGRKYDNIPQLSQYICSDDFKGFNRTLVQRKTNPEFIPPKVNKYNITHNLTPPEAMIYRCMKNILLEIKRKADRLRLNQINNFEPEMGNGPEAVAALRQFNAMKLTLVAYMRQVLICPLIPITSIAIDMYDYKKNTELSEIIMREITKLGLNDYLNDEESIKSSRIRNILETIDKHGDEKIVLFSCFKTAVEIIEQYIPKDRTIFKMTSKMSTQERGQEITNFKNSDNGILLLTYGLGAEGLNLQFASTVILTDFWWNCSKTEQAVARIFRYGQIAEEINIYTFVANTGIEKIMLEKQRAKRVILNEMRTGPIKTEIPKINTDKLIELIRVEDNEKIFDDVYNRTIEDLSKEYSNTTSRKKTYRERYRRRRRRRYGYRHYNRWGGHDRVPDTVARELPVPAHDNVVETPRHPPHLDGEEDLIHVIDDNLPSAVRMYENMRRGMVRARRVKIRGLTLLNTYRSIHNLDQYDCIVEVNGNAIQHLYLINNRNTQRVRDIIDDIFRNSVGNLVVLRVFNIQYSTFRNVTIAIDELSLGNGSLDYIIDNRNVLLLGPELPTCVSEVINIF